LFFVDDESDPLARPAVATSARDGVEVLVGWKPPNSLGANCR